MENPFARGAVEGSMFESPKVRPVASVLNVGTPISEEPALRKRIIDASRTGGNEGEVVYDVRRSDLKPEVRQYADRLYSKIKDFYADYGVTNAADLYAKAKMRKISVPKEKAANLGRMLVELETALKHDALPEGYGGLLPFEFFRGFVDGLNKRIGPKKKVEGLDDWDEYKLIAGKLNGWVKIPGRWLPLLAGELIDKIEGNDIQQCRNIRNVEGKLNGEVLINGHWLPVIAGELVKSIGKMKIDAATNIYNVDGELNGCVKIGGSQFPVISGKLIREIDGKKIAGSDEIRNVDGKLNGKVNVERRWLPVIAGALITEMEGRKIEDCWYVRNIDGKLNGSIKIGGLKLPVIAGEIVDNVDGHWITAAGRVRNVDGKLNGRVWVDEDARLPVISGKLVERIGNMRIEDCWENVRNVDGQLHGVVKIGGHMLPVIGGECVERIQGLQILDVIEHNFSDAGGKFTGKAVFRMPDNTTVERRVVLGEFID